MKAFIFDMDGVIADSEPIHLRAEQAVFQNHGVNVTIEELSVNQGKTDEQSLGDFAKKFGIETPVAELCRQKKLLFDRAVHEQGVPPIDGILELIDAVHESGDFKTAIASSSKDEFISFVVDSLNLRGKFDAIISGTNLPKSKPNPEIYLLTARKLGVAPSDCIVLEDTTNGVKAAKAAGMYCIGFKSPHSGNQDLSAADEIVLKIADIDWKKFLSEES